MSFDRLRQQHERSGERRGARTGIRHAEARSGTPHSGVRALRILQMQSAFGNRMTGRWLSDSALPRARETIQRNGDELPFQKTDMEGRVWTLDDNSQEYYITAANERRVYEEEFQNLLEQVEIAKGWKAHSEALGVRVERSLVPLPEWLVSEKVAFTDSIYQSLAKINRPLIENKGHQPDKQKDASEALSELDLVADVLASKEVSGSLELGAKGPETHGTGEIKRHEQKHGNLPPLVIHDLEVDAYYQTSDGVLHIDEVKDTPQALGDKAKSGEQIARQVEWLRWEQFGPYDPLEDEQEPIKKEVGYMMRAAEPRFDKVLSQEVIDNLKLIDKAQWRRGLPFLNMAGTLMTVAQLQKMYDDAIQWLSKSREAYTKANKKQSQVINTYFNNFHVARQTLAKGPLPWE